MKNLFSGFLRGLIVLSGILHFCGADVLSQIKPPESTSKVKKVLVYNKVGGWVSEPGQQLVRNTMELLSSTKGFEVTHLDSDSIITLEYLKQFQVIVWNNNTNGGASVPDLEARDAVIDYLKQGGGWILFHRAGDHWDTWPELSDIMGTVFIRSGGVGPTELVFDPDGMAGSETRWLLQALPSTAIFEELWMSFTKTVRSLPGVTVLATIRGVPGEDSRIPPTEDGSEDQIYIWSRSGSEEVGKGRFLYNGIGYNKDGFFEANDSLVLNLYWENLRWAAGDYQNGCTDPVKDNYDPEARVDDGSCSALSIKGNFLPGKTGSFSLIQSGRQFTLPENPSLFSAHFCLYDLHGKMIWEKNLAGSETTVIGPELKPGLYTMEIRWNESPDSHTHFNRIFLP